MTCIILAAEVPQEYQWVAAVIAALLGGDGLRRLLGWGRRVIAAANLLVEKADAITDLTQKLSTATELVKDLSESVNSAVERIATLEASQVATDAASGIAKIAWQPDGQCSYVCLEWQSLTGLGMEDARGDGWLESVHADDRPRVRDLWQGFLRGHRRRFNIEEFRVARPDGNFLRCRMRAGRGFSADRKAETIIGFTYRIPSPTPVGA